MIPLQLLVYMHTNDTINALLDHFTFQLGWASSASICMELQSTIQGLWGHFRPVYVFTMPFIRFASKALDRRSINNERPNQWIRVTIAKQFSDLLLSFLTKSS